LATSLGAAELRPTVRRKPIIGVRESAFFGDDDPFDAVRAVRQRSPEEIIAAVTESGLQGRGGAGFPTGAKWSAVRAAPGERKFIVCNADESEPGSFKDRYILDNQPRRLLAGMAIAGHALGASAGVIYIRAEYRPQYEQLLETIDSLHREGALGDGFDVVVRRGGGLYVCGEETALLNSLEGRRPTPRDRPPYPTTHGLLGAPTLVQNVETLSAVPAIVARGAAWYRDAGSPKLYCTSGDVPSSAVFELPMTVTALDLLERAGVVKEGVKAFTLGGLSGGLLPAPKLEMRLDFATPRKHDAFLGSGGVVVADRSRCMVRFAFEAVRFYAGESCGKCFPCRIGTTRLRERLDAALRFEEVDGGELRELMGVVVTGAACGLGPAAALVTRHLLTHFEDEFRAHTEGRRCPAGECGRA
jgi:NADH:ubiquinone oxidoreductase subunit F (NADH-binding)